MLIVEPVLGFLCAISVSFKMPTLHHLPSEGTLKYQRNISFEDQVGTWLSRSGWEVFYPRTDHGHKTDVLVSSGPNFYRLQVKTLCKACPDQIVQNKWRDSQVDYVIYFIPEEGFGYVVKPFKERCRMLSRTSHIRFKSTDQDFCQAFHRIN